MKMPMLQPASHTEPSKKRVHIAKPMNEKAKKLPGGNAERTLVGVHFHAMLPCALKDLAQIGYVVVLKR